MELALILIFIFGYTAIAFEHALKVNKAASALITGVLCWSVYALLFPDTHWVGEQLSHHLGEIASILFFLMGAMTIVEIIDLHDGFRIVTDRIRTQDKRKLLWMISILTFFLSAVLDNLTTTIVILSLLRKLIDDRNDRLFFAGMVVIAANAGGAWSPMGDVTTTMLWIGGQITALNIILMTFIPSLVCLLVPLISISFILKGKCEPPRINPAAKRIETTPAERNTAFFVGLGALLFVPVYKTVTHLLPFMGILFGLGIFWALTELLHKSKPMETRDHLSPFHALRRIDTSSILFFLGILLCIASLQSSGILVELAGWLTENIRNEKIIVMAIGLVSAVVDNVPLVAAAQGMYSLDVYPPDHFFWEFLAYCTGTGGSALIIGSAAGVAAMGIEKIDFFWYVKRISLFALIGYFAGALAYIVQYNLLH